MATRIDIVPEEKDRDFYLKRIGHDEDYGRLVAEDADIYVNDELAIVYRQQWMDVSKTLYLRDQFASLEFSNNTKRSGGMNTNARTFGYMPRRPLRQDFCYRCVFDRENPELFKDVYRVGEMAAKEFKAHVPHVYTEQMELLSVIPSEYKFPNFPFTGGIINQDSSLMYHQDRANFLQSWSAMLGIKKHIETGSGVLVVPQMNVALDVGDGALTLINGTKWWHGVSPIKFTRPDAGRYTMVFYANRQMVNCLPLDQEIQRAQLKRTRVEANRHSVTGVHRKTT